MASNELLGRMAAAIEGALVEQTGGFGEQDDRIVASACALTALRAIREPTAHMIDAATTGAEVPYARQTWIDMVDAALTEHEEG